MSYAIIFAFALPLFFGLAYVFYKFAEFKLNEEQETLSPIFPTDESVVGLSKEELDKVKVKQKEGQRQLAEAIAKVPVELKDGKFVAMSGEALKQEMTKRAMEEQSQQTPVQIQLPKAS